MTTTASVWIERAGQWVLFSTCSVEDARSISDELGKFPEDRFICVEIECTMEGF